MLLTIALLISIHSLPKAIELPAEVAECIAAHPEISIDETQDPVYLKLFFREDLVPDYAIAVIERKTRKSRVLVCRKGENGAVLGLAGRPPFSDMPKDDYMSSHWKVCKRADILEMKKYNKNVPTPVNEAICLTWEDGEAFVYWDGHKFCWKTLSP